jgi:hypothetical protein
MRLRSPGHTRPLPGMRRRADKGHSIVRLRIIHILSALLLLLCLATAKFWYRSDFICDRIAWYGQPHLFDVTSSGGLMNIVWGKVVVPSYPPKFGWNISSRSLLAPPQYSKIDLREGTTLGFRATRWGWRRSSAFGNGYSLTVPYWFLLVCVAILPSATIYRWRRFRTQRLRAASPRCHVCGYDLRATPDRCPECGAVPIGAKP